MREPKDNSFGAYQELNIHLSRIQDLEAKVAKQGQDIAALQLVVSITVIVFVIAPSVINLLTFILERTKP